MNLGNFSFGKKRYFALTGTQDNSMLAEVIRVSSAGRPVIQELATVEGALDDKVTVNRLLSSATDLKGGEISIALPLNFFEIASVNLPILKEEAIGRALPYHLAKVINRPVNEYIYDWQITRRQKENIETTVYLFPTKIFNNFKKEFARKQLEIKYLEADVFAAFAYLAILDKVSEKDATVCALIWPQSLSLAVYEAGQLKLVRSIKLPQPVENFSLPAKIKPPENPPPREIESVPLADDLSLEDEGEAVDFPPRDEKISMEPEITTHDESSAILADFSLMSKENHSQTTADQAGAPEEEAASSLQNGLTSPIELAWQDYLQEINLEIIRTRDYYATVVKGGKIGSLVIGGADVFWQELKDLTTSSIGLPIEPLIENRFESGGSSSLLRAISLGTGARW